MLIDIKDFFCEVLFVVIIIDVFVLVKFFLYLIGISIEYFSVVYGRRV